MEASATTQISRLQKMGVKELQQEYEKAFGKPTKSRNRKQLFSQIAKKIQADRVGETGGDGSIKPTLTVKFERKAKGKQGRKTSKAAAKKEKKTGK
jgi:hypothetical protein